MNEQYKTESYKLTNLLQEYDKAILTEAIKQNYIYQRELEREIKETRERIFNIIKNQ